MKQSCFVASLLVVLALAGCERKSPGNPLPPQKPPAPKVGSSTMTMEPAVWRVLDQTVLDVPPVPI